MSFAIPSQFRDYPLRLLLAKGFGRLRRIAGGELQRLRDKFLESYGGGQETLRPVALRLRSEDIPEDLCAYLAAVAPAYIEHRFNLLGSGWVRVAHGIACAGFDGQRYPSAPSVNADPAGHWLAGRINRTNLAAAQQAWQLIGRAGYVPIDWQLDFKSGFRWSELTCHLDVRIGSAAGADIKLPRELARMQHLPQLALCALRASSGDVRFADAGLYVDEIGAQLLDFIATNPPRFGVNWACAMDVAIRAANWLLSLDLLASGGLGLERSTRALVSRSIVDHAIYVADHLEWSEVNRTNHYLADLVGLLYVGARLDASPRSDAWLAFAVRELTGEALTQFHPQGSCYEGSTSYHRLSAELVLFGVALATGLPESRRNALTSYRPDAIQVRPNFPPPPVPDFPDATGRPGPVSAMVAERLWRAARFSEAVSRCDGRISQIGDTDSGRLFWLHPVAVGGHPPGRDDLDHRALIESIDALFSPTVAARWFDSMVVRALAGEWMGRVPEPVAMPGDRGDATAIEAEINRQSDACRRVRRFPLARSANPWRRVAYPAFGLYVFRRDDDFVAFRCWGQLEAGTPDGHLHDDNLGIEIVLGGKPLIQDPGTYVYTADPQARNLYRSASAHDVPRARAWDVAPPGSALFSLRPNAAAECTCWQADAVGGRIVADEGTLYRLVRFRDDALEIWDGISGGELAPLGNAPTPCIGYGRKA